MHKEESVDLLSSTDLQESDKFYFDLRTLTEDGKQHSAKTAERGGRGRKLFFAIFWVFIVLLFLTVVYLAFQGFVWQRSKGHGAGSHPAASFKGIFPSWGNDRPPYKEKARMARYIVHKSQWGVLTTFSTHVKGYPWGEVVSVSDGLTNNSTGIPLIYISTMDIAAHDLDKTPQASFTFSEAQGDWCRTNKIDPEDPRCARVHLFGNLTKLTPDEIPSAKTSMFTRHPVMAHWPESHHFFFAKIKLSRVEVLDFFGPISQVSVDDYLKAKP